MNTASLNNTNSECSNAHHFSSSIFSSDCFKSSKTPSLNSLCLEEFELISDSSEEPLELINSLYDSSDYKTDGNINLYLDNGVCYKDLEDFITRESSTSLDEIQMERILSPKNSSCSMRSLDSISRMQLPYLEYPIESIISDYDNLSNINIYETKRSLIEDIKNHPYCWLGVVLIGFSILFQITTGLTLIWNTHANMTSGVDIITANRINNFIIFGVFLITAINLFIATFRVMHVPAQVSINVDNLN